MRLLLDEMFPPAVAKQLRAGGHDVVAVLEPDDLRGAADPDLFEIAQTEGRAMLTENVPDYMRLDRIFREAGREHYGLVFALKSGGSAKRIVGRLVRELDAFLMDHPEDRPTCLVSWL